jgi:hypothetical protein
VKLAGPNPLKFTWVVAAKPVPLMVTVEPVGPAVGVNEVMAGPAGAGAGAGAGGGLMPCCARAGPADPAKSAIAVRAATVRGRRRPLRFITRSP